MLTPGLARYLRVEYSVVVLPLPVGPGDQDEAVRLGDPAFVGLAFFLREAEVDDLGQKNLGIEDSNDDLFAEGDRQRRHSKLDLAFAPLGLDSAVLRTPLFGDIHPRQDLDAGDERGMHGRRNLADVVQDAVDAQPQLRLISRFGSM